MGVRRSVLVRTLPLLAAAASSLVLGAAPAPAAVPVLVVDGQGFGHGVGMAQDGALWMGRAGASLEQILGHFYPGVGLGRASGPVRVVVHDDPDGDVTLTFPNGGEVRSPRSGPQAAGFPVTVAAGGAVRIRHEGGAYRVVPVGPVRARSAAHPQLLPLPRPPGPTTTTTTPGLLPRPAPTPTTTTPPPTTSPERISASSVWAAPAGGGLVGLPALGARYRGVVEAAAGDGGLRVVNELDVEQYLRGMGEVRDPSWPLASLQAQTVAARTYALRAMRANGEICATQRCQVYLGQHAEYAAMDTAVQSTSGKVLTYGGALAAAVYSANGGGFSATPAEGFGTPDGAHPYLRAAPYETRSPDVWQVRITLSDLQRRLTYPGEVSSVEISSTGPSGRPLEVTMRGSAGPRAVPALAVQRALGLRSTKWSTRVESGAAPPPPLAVEAVQSLPEDIGLFLPQPQAEVRAASAVPDDDSATPRWPALVASAAVLLTGTAAVRRLQHG